MNETRHEKGSVPSVIANYRKRQERAMRLLLAFWIGIMLLILSAGYLTYRFLNAKNNPSAPVVNETPQLAPSETVAVVAPPVAVTTPAPATDGVLAQTEQLSVTESPPATEEPASARVVTYQVQEGDTLVSIATQFGIGISDLIALNPLVTPEFLSVGDQLAIPAQFTTLATPTLSATGESTVIEYQVVSGDTLAAIAARFGASVDLIVRENGLASPDEIRVGETLRIPVEPGALPTSTSTQIP